MKKQMNKILFLALSLAVCGAATAGDFEWSGLYRFEANHIENSELNSDTDAFKDYGLHHLILKPKIVAADGLTIYGRFDILNNTELTNSVHGQIFGGTTNRNSTTDIEQTDAGANNMGADSFLATQLYATLHHEFGALTVGRAPVHFGLGVNLNSGDGDFDHYMDTRDLISYEIAMGNYSFVSTYGKLVEAIVNKNDDDVNEYLFQLNYDNPDVDLKMGLAYQMRRSSKGSNDIPTGAGKIGGATPTYTDGFEFNNISLYFERTRETLRWALESAFIDGNAGVTDADSKSVSLKSYTLAFEFDYMPQGSDFEYGFNFGLVSGDDPDSTDTYEGAALDPNYDIAFLLFNHPLGSADIINSSLYGGGASANNTALDFERVTNTTYFAPYFNYQWKQNWKVKTSLVLAQLNQVYQLGAQMEKDLGSELDVALIYKPNDNLTWENTAGFLFPGSAFKGTTSDNFNTDSALGLMSRIAIRF